MAQNWWELFPEVLPSPAASGQGGLPGPGAFAFGPELGHQADLPNGASAPNPGPSEAFDPGYLSGGDLGANGLPGTPLGIPLAVVKARNSPEL